MRIKNKNFFNKLIIKKDSTWKALFDNVMLIAACYNTFTQAYYAAFGFPSEAIYQWLDVVIEFLFTLDFIFCFCQEFKDEETYTIVSDIKKIAKHYLRGSCLFDLLAIIPFEYFFHDPTVSASKDTARMYRLVKLLRVPRLFELLNVDRFK